MRLVDDWRHVTARSLSFWMFVFGILSMICPELWYRFTGQDYDPFLAWWIGMGLLVAGLIGRLIRQDLPHWQEWLRIIAVTVIVVLLALVFAGEVRAAPATEAQTLDVAVPFIAEREGERLVAYIPMKGDVPTIGFGHTDGVHMGMTITHQQAIGMLRQDVASYRDRLHDYFTPATIWRRLPPTRDAAYTSLAYNCGVYSIGRSTAVRRLNAGNVKGACEAITWWSRAGHRLIRGLFVRRKAEESLCLKD